MKENAFKKSIKLIIIEILVTLVSVGMFYIINFISIFEAMPTLSTYICFAVVAFILPCIITFLIYTIIFTRWIANKVLEPFFKKNGSKTDNQKDENKHNSNSSIVTAIALGIFATSLISTFGSKVFESVCEIIELIRDNQIEQLYEKSYNTLTFIILMFPSLGLLGGTYDKLCDSIMEIYKKHKKAISEIIE